MSPLGFVTGPGRSPARSVKIACAACALVALVSVPGVRARDRSPDPPVQLVESVPVETSLGNPDLPRAADVWPALIRGARRTVDLEEFYLTRWPGEALEPVLDAIGAAAQRGVKVRILLDARMHRTHPQPADSLGALPGVEVRTIDMRRLGGGVQHAKYFIVDGETVYLGSQNLDWRSLSHIHELGVRIRDPRAARYYGRVFAMDWAAAGAMAAGDSVGSRALGLAAGRASDAARPITIIQGPRDTVRMWPGSSPLGFIPEGTWDRDGIVRLIDRARHEVVLQSLTYSTHSVDETDSTLDAALRRAASRGVQVRLLISDWQAEGRRIEELAALGAVPNIVARLSVVPEWSGGYIPFARVDHSKYMVVDTLRLWVGTSNWSPEYFTRSRNVAAIFENRGLARAARVAFENGWNAGTLDVRPGVDFTPRVHGEEPPPGKVKYGG